MRTLTVTLILVASAVVGGCATHSHPVAEAREMTAAERNFDDLWKAALGTLRKYSFDIRRQDRRDGLIVTAPMTGQYFFELWRRDAATPLDLAESSIQTIYRTARVTIKPTAPGASTYSASVEVETTRSNRQVLQLTSVSEVYDMFGLPGNERSRRKFLLDTGADAGRPRQNVVQLGRDEGLEAKLAADIRRGVHRR